MEKPSRETSNPAAETVGELPYADVGGIVLRVIYASLQAIYGGKFAGRSEEDIGATLREIAQQLETSATPAPNLPQGYKNAHLWQPEQLIGEQLEEEDEGGVACVQPPLPRVSRLCLEAVYHADKRLITLAFEEHSKPKAICIPSPLAILVDALTVPAHPESHGYGFALARAMLFSLFRVHPTDPGASRLLVDEVRTEIERFRNRRRFSVTAGKSAFLAHFLALSGQLVLHIGRKAQSVYDRNSQVLAFLDKNPFTAGSNIIAANESTHLDFMRMPGLDTLPETQEILNNLMGIPLPISGAPTVFFGGLQRSPTDSLVMSVNGEPGTGKTSFALALAAALAPLGTHCYYCSFEEEELTLQRRAKGLVPEYLLETSLPNTRVEDWLTVIPLDPLKVEDVEGLSDRYIPQIKNHLLRFGDSPPRAQFPDILPAIAPVLVVLDSLTPLTALGDRSAVHKACQFVATLRELNCIVLVLSAQGIAKDTRLEYLADTVIDLRHEGTKDLEEKPFRIFQLLKSRLQMSRPGSHLFHLSGERGVRISPQLASQLDAHEIHTTPTPDRSIRLDTLHEADEPGVDSPDPALEGHLRLPLPSDARSNPLVKLFPKSRIFIHGHGSGGKAVLGLKLLMAGYQKRSKRGQAAEGDSAENWVAVESQRPRRILAVSFLYPAHYYSGQFNMLLRSSAKLAPPGKRDQSELQVLAFAPGFIYPEDFITKVLLELDRAHLEGRPYTGVLLDGLHNTFLQFPALQKRDLVWAALHSLLRRYELTTVTTFTTFLKVGPHKNAQSLQRDEELLLKGQLPFLHALVQGTDYYLDVEPFDRNFYEIRVISSISHPVPSEPIFWQPGAGRFLSRLSMTNLHQRTLPLDSPGGQSGLPQTHKGERASKPRS